MCNVHFDALHIDMFVTVTAHAAKLGCQYLYQLRNYKVPILIIIIVFFSAHQI